MKRRFRTGDTVVDLEFDLDNNGNVSAKIGEKTVDATVQFLAPHTVLLEINNHLQRFLIYRTPQGNLSLLHQGSVLTLVPEEGKRRAKEAETSLSSPMPGKIIKVLCEEGAKVTKSEVLLVVEAMKMELPIKAHRDGVVQKLSCEVGQRVDAGIPLVEIQ